MWKPLGAAHIPYELYGSVRFYDRMEIKDALAYMRLIVSDDDEAFERVINLPDGISAKPPCRAQGDGGRIRAIAVCGAESLD